MNSSVSFRLVVLAIFFMVAGCASNKPAPVVDRTQGATPVSAPVADSNPGAEIAKPVPPVERVARKGYYIVKEGDTLYRIALDNGQAYRDLAAWNNLEDANKIKVGQELRVVSPEADDTQAVAIAKPVGVVKGVEQRPLDGNTDLVKEQPKVGREPYSDEALARLGKSAELAAIKPEVKPDAKPESRPDPKPVFRSDDDVQWGWPANGKIGAQFVEGGSKGLDILGKKGDPVLAASDGKVVYSGSGLRGYGKLLIVKHNNTFLTAYAHNSNILVKEGQPVTKGQKIAEMGDTEADQVKLHFEVRRQGKPVDPLKHLPPR